MRSQIILHNSQPIEEDFIDDPGFRRLSVKNVKTKFYRLKQDTLTVQSVSNGIANIQVIECSTENQTVQEFEVRRPTIVFEVIVSSNLSFLSEDTAPDEFHEPTCSLVVYPKGLYQCHFHPGNHHLILVSIDSSWLHRRIDLYPYLDQIFQAQNLNEFFRLDKRPYKNQIKRVLASFLYEEEHTYLDKAFKSLLDRILKKYDVLLREGVLLSEEEDRNRIEQLRQFIKENYANDIAQSNTLIAEHFFVSERSLRRLANRAFGHGIKQEVIDYKMSYAWKYLALMNKNVTEVAELTGYENVQYFSKAFKQYWKINPTEVYKPKTDGH